MIVIVSVKFHRKRSNTFQIRKFKFCFLQVHAVSMATAAILEVVYIAEARAHDGYHLCEVLLRKA
jgi:hypothetical protein